jgi:hypothetical protein
MHRFNDCPFRNHWHLAFVCRPLVKGHGWSLPNQIAQMSKTFLGRVGGEFSVRIGGSEALWRLGLCEGGFRCNVVVQEVIEPPRQALSEYNGSAVVSWKKDKGR